MVIIKENGNFHHIRGDRSMMSTIKMFKLYQVRILNNQMFRYSLFNENTLILDIRNYGFQFRSSQFSLRNDL